VNNAFGAALLAVGRTEESIPHLTAALNARPDYFDARYNLGNALASLGDFRGALAQFQAAVRINPEDANAEANLGSAFAETGDLKQAKLHYERALRLNPNHELARETCNNSAAKRTHASRSTSARKSSSTGKPSYRVVPAFPRIARDAAADASPRENPCAGVTRRRGELHLRGHLCVRRFVLHCTRSAEGGCQLPCRAAKAPRAAQRALARLRLPAEAIHVIG